MKKRPPYSGEEWQGLYNAEGLRLLARSVVIGTLIQKGYDIRMHSTYFDEVLRKLEEPSKDG
jgi:hypothetical protein